MLRPRFTIRLMLGMILLIGCGLGLLTATREPITNRSNYDKIQLGMTRSEVEALLGDKPIDLAPLDFEDVAFVESARDLLVKYPPPHTCGDWKGETYMISVIFDKNGRVGSKYFKRNPDATMLDHVADWIGI